jgi:hypothetical protein
MMARVMRLNSGRSDGGAPLDSGEVFMVDYLVGEEHDEHSARRLLMVFAAHVKNCKAP